MRKLKSLFAVLMLVFVLSATALAGELNCPPGETQGPPGYNAMDPGQLDTPPGETNAPPGETQTPPSAPQGAGLWITLEDYFWGVA